MVISNILNNIKFELCINKENKCILSKYVKQRIKVCCKF